MPRKTVEELYAFGPRRVGTPEGGAAVDYLEGRFRDAGLVDVRREPVPVHRYRVDEHSLTIGAEPHPGFPIPYTRLTGAEGVTGPLVHVPGRRALREGLDVTGKVVVVDIRFPMLRGKALKTLALGLHDPGGTIPDGDLHPATWIRKGWELYDECHRRGAVGFLGVLCDQPGGHDTYYAPYGFREGDRILDKPLPGMWISKRRRDELLRRAADGDPATLRTVGELAATTSDNLIGYVRGESEETVIVGCHHDSPFFNAVEDSSGMAVVVELAERAARAARAAGGGGKPRRTLLFLATTGHFYGSIGTRDFIARHADLLRRHVVAEVHIEHVALEAAESATDGTLQPTGLPETAGVFTGYNRPSVEMVERMLAGHDLDRTLILGAHGPLGDYPPTDGGDFYEAGVPVFNFISNPVYLLVDDDGLERVDWERLPRLADGFDGLLRDLDGVDRAALRRSHFVGKRALARTFTLLNRLKSATGR